MTHRIEKIILPLALYEAGRKAGVDMTPYAPQPPVETLNGLEKVGEIAGVPVYLDPKLEPGSAYMVCASDTMKVLDLMYNASHRS